MLWMILIYYIAPYEYLQYFCFIKYDNSDTACNQMDYHTWYMYHTIKCAFCCMCITKSVYTKVTVIKYTQNRQTEISMRNCTWYLS